ncbi:chemoreceptor glutamine deamidase CheD [Geothrix sp. 21YS21S-4]|uniref:chemoreceptor glutamine deamidase CheD n=1 Tax=Geothrix sp. 21YS21S-4 TaxID=3068889 RepID=UPI0027BAA567|nr:chemoreceptor glutamine deamidase CheD [Geothrix sp. 21YS21S-4]
MTSSLAPLVQGRASKYLDRHFNRQAMKILPGEFYATVDDEVIVTVLGSCVTACLLDPIAMVGGMNHFMLPLRGDGEPDPDVFSSARYGAAAMDYLIDDLVLLGAERSRLVAKAFGGGRVVRGLPDIGGQNIDFVRGFLRDKGIPLWSEDMGGTLPRKIYFFPHTGQVLVKRIQRLHNDTIFDRERAYLFDMASSRTEGGTELPT